MSLLVPDYSSSSDDEAAPRAPAPSTAAVKAAAPSSPPTAASVDAISALALPEPTKKPTTEQLKKKKKKKTTAKAKKTALFLPPEIQRLLEGGGTLSDSDGDDADGAADHLLAKHKRAVAKRPRPEPRDASDLGSALTFLPAPKRQLSEPAPSHSTVVQQETAGASASASAAPEATAELDPQAQQLQEQQYAEYYQQYYNNYYYAYHQQQQQQQQQQAEPSEEQTQSDRRRARHRDRELERLLQQGQFDAVKDKIVEVQGPAPDAWQAPVDQLERGDPNDVKVRASFWSSSAGGTVSSMKPSRLQRQKHQLNQLAFDAKMREFELLDRKGAALKTKRETHAKYGW
ncbi:hypothetical protein PINS_up004857 [Pythium insidiosum]|nr:hypothetical protein PINS_up004857 [Pythium insidiosum]